LGQLIVSKFGGSSVADACAIKRCAKIVKEEKGQPFVVVSATYDTTNQLEKLAQLSLESTDDAQIYLNTIIKRHEGISKELEIFENVSESFKELHNEAKSIISSINHLAKVTPRLMDVMYSIGERLSSRLVAAYLKAEYIDARDILRTDDFFGAANPMLNVSKALAQENLLPIIRENKVIVTQGFISSTIESATTTLGREGSDYSAALFAEMLGADLIKIWTDVPGIFTCDPKVAEGVKRIPEMSYRHATKMASLGAKVLFPRTLAPAKRADIKVFVGSSLAPEKGGTIISGVENETPSLIGLAQEEMGETLNISIIGQKINEIADFSPLNYLDKNGVEAIEVDKDSTSSTFQITKENSRLAIRILHDYMLSFSS